MIELHVHRGLAATVTIEAIKAAVEAHRGDQRLCVVVPSINEPVEGAHAPAMRLTLGEPWSHDGSNEFVALIAELGDVEVVGDAEMFDDDDGDPW